MRLRFLFDLLMPFRHWRRRRRIARLHEGIDREQRSIEALEAAKSEPEIEAVLAQRRSRRSRRAMLVATAVVAIGTAAGASAFVATRDGGAKAARSDPQVAGEMAAEHVVDKRPPACPFFNPPSPDVLVKHRSFRFEDGGGFSNFFFSLVHPPGFSQAPLYTQHYELFVRKAPHVRIRVGYRTDAEAGDPDFFLALARSSLRETRGFVNLGTRREVVGCEPTLRWDYERVVDGERLRAERYFLVTSTKIYHHTAYDILFEAPAKAWRHWHPVFAYVKASFRVDWHMAGTKPPRPR
jgi:hypothetical protein